MTGRVCGRGSLALLGLLAVVAGCVSIEGPAEPPIPLSRTADSPVALGRAVLDALRHRDAAQLESLAITEAEFRDLVWPELPSSRPAMGLSFDYAWQELRQKSAADLRRTLAGWGGRRLELVDVRFLGETTEYGSFRVSRDSLLDVRTESGEPVRIRVFGSVIEYDGRVKVFSYVLD